MRFFCVFADDLPVWYIQEYLQINPCHIHKKPVALSISVQN